MTDAKTAAQPGAPKLYDEVPNNTVLDFHYGDSDKVNAAFAMAAHVTRATLDQQPRLCGGDGAARGCRPPTIRRMSASPSISVARPLPGNRNGLADLINVPPEKVRVHLAECRRLVRHEGAAAIRNTSASSMPRASWDAR